MPNKKINQLDVRVAVATDLMLVGDPSTGTAYKSTLATLPLVPTSRTLTINGVAFDLLQNRAWTIGTVTSVGLSMPSAFSVANSPITSSGTLAVTATGTAAQYIRGDGQLATLPSNSSGGSAVAYYLNGSVTASVGTYFQMSKIPVIGTGTDFSKAGNGLISQFLTDVADPNRLEIPAGNWNFEMYMSASSSGGTPEFYVELLKYNGTTFTSIASSSANPEAITGGTTIDLYLTSLAIPQTTLLSTDRLAIRVYIVNSTGGRTITMHTENSHLCEIVTNFAGGVSALNGLTANTQYFATGTIGTNFAISSVGDTHTFNLPTASGTNRGALSSADWTTFNGKQAALTLTTTGTSGAATLVGATLNIPQYSGGGGGMAIGGSITSATAGSVLFAGASGVLQQDNANLFWDDTNNRLGIGTTAPAFTLDTRSDIVINGWVIGKGSNTSLNNLRITEQANASFNNVTTANNNIFIGRNTGLSLTTGIGNVSLGQSAGQIISSGNYNFSLGYLSAVRLQTGENNISIGTESLLYIVGQSNNIAFGFRAGAYINGYTNATPSSSIYIGNSCFSGAVTASNEIVIGNGTGTIGLGSNTTMIGNNSTVTAAIRGRLLLGTTTDSGLYQLDVNGTARVSDTFTAGTSTFTNKLNAQFGTFGIQSYAVNNGFMSDNMYYNGSSWTRLATGYGFGYQFYNGSVLFQGVNTGTGTFTPNAIMKVDYAGNFLLGQTLSATPLDFTNAKLRFTNNGRLLLGTTTESTYILDVFNTARFQDTLTIGASAFTNKLNTEIGSIGIQSFFKNNAFITDNYYYNGTTTTRTNTGYAFGMHFYNGSLSFLGANTGTGAFTPNYKFKFDYEGAFVIGDNLSLGAADYTNATALFTKNGRFLLGTTTENTSALLNVTSTTQGFLPPRMTTTQKNAIATPASGLQVYDSTLNQMSYYNGTTWINF